MDTQAVRRILDEALTWKNTPYHHKGRVKGVGVDCGGFIYEVFNKWLPLPAFPRNYPEDWSLHKEGNELYLDFIMPFVREIRDPKPADLLLFQYGRNFGHAALYMGGNRYIHAWGKTGVGSVKVSNINFFRIGIVGPRNKKVYTVRDEYLKEFDK